MCRSAKTDAPIKHHLPTWQPVGLSDLHRLIFHEKSAVTNHHSQKNDL